MIDYSLEVVQKIADECNAVTVRGGRKAIYEKWGIKKEKLYRLLNKYGLKIQDARYLSPSVPIVQNEATRKRLSELATSRWAKIKANGGGGKVAASKKVRFLNPHNEPSASEAVAKLERDLASTRKILLMIKEMVSQANV